MKLSNKNKFNQGSWRIKALSTAVIIGLVSALTQANAVTSRKPIGDLEIYKAAKPGTASIFMMLDVSGSMSTYDSSCRTSKKTQYSEAIRLVTYKRKLAADSTPTNIKLLLDESGQPIIDFSQIENEVTFTPRGCYGYDGQLKVDRLTRLKIALMELLADRVYTPSNAIKPTGSLPDDYEIGMGSYTDRYGKVRVPNRALTSDQRWALIEDINSLSTGGGTPTAHALAEAGAYMMGTTITDTSGYPKVTAESNYPYNDDDEKRYRQCLTNDTAVSFNDIVQAYVLDCITWGNWKTSHPNRGDSNKVASGNSEFTSGEEKKIYYYARNESSYSGFSQSTPLSKKADGMSYSSPLSTKECSGNGIYLLTDGEPNGSNDNRAKELMNKSLSASNPALSVSSCNGLTGGSSSGAWGCMAEYAALLRNPANNPLKLPIKTATVGFGKNFEGLTGKRTITINGESKEVVDCNSGNNENTENLCKLGERRGDNETKTFGDGGFYYTEESSEIAASIVDFSSSLVQIINTAPSGTITIPQDPYRASNQLPYAYLPMLDPDIASANSIWKGNLKKYALDQGTLFGNSSKLLYKDVAGNLDPDTQDLWQSTDYLVDSVVSNNSIEAGGVYAKLKSPKSGLSSLRTVYVEDHTAVGNPTPVLRKLSVNGSGVPVGFDKLVDVDKVTDTGTFNQLNKRRILSFLGFDQVLTKDGQPTSTIDVEDLVLTAPTKEVKVLGGVVHSKPTAISYSSTLDANGRITDTRDDYVLFGSMDGALHLVDADTGEEEFAIITKAMLERQPEALVDGSIKADVGKPYFGVDAPWLVTTDYKYDLNPAPAVSTVKVDDASGKGMFAYGGLRMGGTGLYGIDISDKSDPKMMFTYNPAGRNNTTSNDNFARLGQTWSKPTEAKIRLTKDAEPTDVIIFGGGYDMSYEEEDYVPTSAAPARGNAIYMVRASDGELLWSSSNTGTTNSKYNKVPSMINSITAEITVLDRDNDGLMDHIYAADLGGQVFRADFENARPAKYGFTEVAAFSNKRMVRVLDVAPTDSTPAYRFYERPIVSFYRNESAGANNGQLFALVNVISGNRSAPLSTLRNTTAFANRVYGIIDNDVTNTQLYDDSFTPTIQDLTEAKLTNLSTALGAEPDEATKIAAKSAMVEGSKHGWYYPLTRFDGYNNVRYNKGVGDSVVINNLLYTTVYNPDKRYSNAASCTAEIAGGSERQIYCLPYGVCMDSTSTTGTGGFIPVGQGIQELTLGAYNKDNTDIKVLIGTTTITERIKAANRSKYGADTNKDGSNIKDLYSGEAERPVLVGGDGSAAEYLFSERYTLQPKVWYERK